MIKLEKINNWLYQYKEDNFRYQIELHYPSLFIPNHPIKHNAYIFKDDKMINWLHDDGGQIKCKECTYDRAEKWLFEEYKKIKNI